jgi:hypothetical protein
MARPANKKTTARTVRARVRGGSLDLLERIPLRDGDEVVVTISEAPPAKDIDALRRAAGAWRGLVEADELIANIYADRLISTRPSPYV